MACEQLLATSRAKTKPLGKKLRAHVVDRAEKALSYLVLHKYRPVGGPLQHDGEILYRLAAEVCFIGQRLGPDADRLFETFGQLVMAYDEKWAKHLKRYVRACDGSSDDGRLSAVYDEAFRVQQPKSYAIRKARERRNAAREQRRGKGSQAGKQEDKQPSPQEEVRQDETVYAQANQADPEVLEVECEDETKSDPAIPEPETEPDAEPECDPDHAPGPPRMSELPPLPTLSGNGNILSDQKPVGNWADECEDLEVWN